MKVIRRPDTVESYLMRVGQAQRRLVENRLQEMNLHRGQPPLLFVLNQQDGLSNSELAELLNVTPPTISNMVKRMRQSGYVEKRSDSNDERVTRVYLTEQGREAMGALQQIIDDVNETMSEGLSAEELATLLPILEKIMINIENTLGESGC